MSPFFVKKFRKSNPCPKCPYEPAKGRSLCSTHLKIARLAWRVWSYGRRIMHRCCDCDRREYKLTGRCRPHRERNLERLNKWLGEHPQQWRVAHEKKKELLRRGLCPQCAEHRPVAPDMARCAQCRLVNAHRAETREQQTVNGVSRAHALAAWRRAGSNARARSVAEAAATELAKMGFEASAHASVRKLEEAAA